MPKLAPRMFIRAKIDAAYLMGDADHGNFAINAYGVIFNNIIAAYSNIAAVFCATF